jgi:hypothetical protein
MILRGGTHSANEIRSCVGMISAVRFQCSHRPVVSLSNDKLFDLRPLYDGRFRPFVNDRSFVKVVDTNTKFI